MIKINIPGREELSIKHLVLDFNGTIAKDGKVTEETKEYIKRISEDLQIHLVTADTFGSVQKECTGLPVFIKILESDNHTREKEDYVISLGKESVIAFGNGMNDRLLLAASALSVGIMGEEGAAFQTLSSSDVVIKKIDDAFELLLYPKRLIATLRE